MSTGDPGSLAGSGDLSQLQESLNRQQEKISALKELVRKSEVAHGKSTSTTQEKVKNIAQRLSHIKSKARSRQNLDSSQSELKDEPIFEETAISSPLPASQKRAETPGSEKIQLLRRQVEESKMKMAEREHSKREIEERVTQLKAKFDSTQQSLERSSELGRSMGDLSVLSPGCIKEKFKSAADLSFVPLNLDKEKIKFLENRVKLLEKQIEKQSHVAPDLEIELVSSLRNRILDLEENLREKECIIEARTQAVSLMSESLSAKAANTVDTLKDTRLEMQKMQATFIESENLLHEEIKHLRSELNDKSQKIQNLEEVNDILETARFELTLKNADLENKLLGVQEYSTKLDEHSKLNEALQLKINKLEEQLAEKTVECNVLNANFSVLQEKLKSTTPKSIFSKTADEETEIEMKKLKDQLDEANKSMIKIKLKSKQLQKQVDKFTKLSDTNSELIKLTEENQELQMKIVELEEEKGCLQLKLLTGGSDNEKVCDSELENKIKVLEKTCQNQTSAIQLLEEQKLELQTTNQELEAYKEQHESKAAKEESVEVSSQIEAIQLEEQAEDYMVQINNLSIALEQLKGENETLHKEICLIDDEKQELQKRVNHYIAENIELLDKVEKLSKSSSSAESIEIVERLTHQEKLEMEKFNQKISAEQEPEEEKHAKEKIDMPSDPLIGEELSDSLVKLREESSELMHRIELFTTERREVLEKMEILTSENHDLQKQIQEMKEKKSLVEDSLTKSKLEIVSLEEKLDKALQEASGLNKQLEESRELKAVSEKEIDAISKVRETLKIDIPSAEMIKQYTSSLDKLRNELENYRKSNDKNSRLNASKKLAKEAKNVCEQYGSLLGEISAQSTNANKAESLDTGELVKLKKKCKELEAIVSKLTIEIQTAGICMNEKDLEIEKFNIEINSILQREKETNEFNQSELESLQQLRKELESKLGSSDSEINILKALVAEQKQQIIDSYTEHELELNNKLAKIQEYEILVEELQTELAQIHIDRNENRIKHEAILKEEIKKLENHLTVNEKLIDDQLTELNNKQSTIETLNAQIMDLYKTMEENARKVIEKEDEIAYLQELLDANKAESDILAKENEQNKMIIAKVTAELHANKSRIRNEDTLCDLQENNKKLEATVAKLEETNIELDAKNKEHVEKLKKFAANLKRKTAHCIELETKLKEFETNSSILSNVESDHLHVLKALQDELQKYKNQMENIETSSNEKAVQLQQEITALINERDSVMEKSKSLLLQNNNMEKEIYEYKAKIDYFERSVNEMQHLVESLHQDINGKDYEIERLQSELGMVKMESKNNEKLLAEVNDELKNKNLKFEKSKALIKEKNREIQRLKLEIEELQNKMTETTTNKKANCENPDHLKLREEHEQLVKTYQSESATFQETISRLETLYDGIQAKFQENMSYIESLETENNTYKEKIIKLENCIASFEERRLSLQRQTDLLDAQLQKQTDEYERNEDALIYRLNKLLDHDDVIGRRLVETQERKEELVDKVEQLCNELSELQLKLSKTEIELDAVKNEKLNELKAENESLQEKLEKASSELTRQQNIYEGRLSQKHAEIDDLENDLSIQLSNINQEKRKLQECAEKAQDEMNELKDENVKLKESNNALEQMRSDLEREITWIRMQNDNMTQDQYELQELRMQSMQDKTEIDNLKHQLDTLVQNHEIELNDLREQITELDSVRMQVGQNQTDDQVFIQNENKRLKEELAEKESAIENYQKENLKLQMASMASSQTPADPFQSSSQMVDINSRDASLQEVESLNEKIKHLENDLIEFRTLLTEKDKLYQEALLDAQTTKELLEKAEIRYPNIRTELQNQTKSHSHMNDGTEVAVYSLPSSHINDALDELVTVRHLEPLHQDASKPDQKKIEDLQRNVSDLEKYANELENKLKSLNNIHENTVQQLQECLRRHEESNTNYEARIKVLEEKAKEQNIQCNIESLIIPNSPPIENTPRLNLFFNNAPQTSGAEFDRIIQGPIVTTSDETHNIPVQEEIIVPKKAYLVYPEAHEMGTDEGWGWGSEEAVLEERHQQQLQYTMSNDNAKIAEYKERINEIELERSRSDEKVIELQIKCGKLVKKLREYKARIDQEESEKAFRKSTSIDSSDLDQAIQDELKLQIGILEGQLVDIRKQSEKELAEKENLLKRIDVLTSGNERLTEMKERQDIEVESLQLKVRQLSQKLQKLEDWNDRDESSSQKLFSESPATITTSMQKELEMKLETTVKELEDLRIDRDELQALLEDERNNILISESKVKELKDRIVDLENAADKASTQLNECSSLKRELKIQSDILSNKEADLQKTLAMNENFQFQLNDYQLTINQLSSESDKIKDQLIKLQTEYSDKVNENAQLSGDLKVWMTKCEEFSKKLDALQLESRVTETNDLLEKRLLDLTSQLQYKEAEILHLKQKINDIVNEDKSQLLSQELLGKNHEIVQLQKQLERLVSSQKELESKLSKSTAEKINLQTFENIDAIARIGALEKELSELKEEKQHMEAELQVLNDHILNSIGYEDKVKEMILELDAKNVEIEDLKNTVTSLKQEQQQRLLDVQPSSSGFENELKLKIDELNQSWEKTVEEKCSEIADSWRHYLDEREAEFKQVESNLNLEIEQLRAGIVVPKRKISKDMEFEEVETVDVQTAAKLQEALEQQELEIVTLKEQLAMRSAEYARLAARHDPYALSTTSNLSFEPKTQRKLSASSSVGDQPGLVPKSELDLALYMLHQRDMRCEELTLELVNLLEERDTLQLKLSNSLRQIEENKQKTSYFESGSESDQPSSNANSPEKLSKLKANVAIESNQQRDNLNSKLSQLQTVGYSKDKRIREEREQRQRQMEQIQQDVANIPSEAVSELVGSDLANTIQSPSNVLLDWLWGRSSNSQQS